MNSVYLNSVLGTLTAARLGISQAQANKHFLGAK